MTYDPCDAMVSEDRRIAILISTKEEHERQIP